MNKIYCSHNSVFYRYILKKVKGIPNIEVFKISLFFVDFLYFLEKINYFYNFYYFIILICFCKNIKLDSAMTHVPKTKSICNNMFL